jgi:hypothetical protein
MDTIARQAFASIRRRRVATRRAPTVATLAVLAVLLAACGGGGADAAHSSTTTSPRSTTSASTTSSQSAEAAAVLSGYRDAWHAFEHALADANPSDPLLAATMVDPQLQGVKANLLADQRQGIVGRGSFALHPKIVSMSATTATVVDCAHSTAALVYQSTGKPVPPVTPPENDGVHSTLVLTGGTWKVTKQTVTDGKCTAGE